MMCRTSNLSGVQCILPTYLQMKIWKYTSMHIHAHVLSEVGIWHLLLNLLPQAWISISFHSSGPCFLLLMRVKLTYTTTPPHLMIKCCWIKHLTIIICLWFWLSFLSRKHGTNSTQKSDNISSSLGMWQSRCGKPN